MAFLEVIYYDLYIQCFLSSIKMIPVRRQESKLLDILSVK